MPWDDGPGAGFTSADVRPWLPLGDTRERNVARQRGDRGSMLHFVRDLIAFRRAQPDLTSGDYARLAAPPGGWAWRRGTSSIVALNLSDKPLTFPDTSATPTFSTTRGLIENGVQGPLHLEPWEGAICSSGSI